MLLTIGVGIAAFILGALVYRNNSTKFNELVLEVKELKEKIAILIKNS